MAAPEFQITNFGMLTLLINHKDIFMRIRSLFIPLLLIILAVHSQDARAQLIPEVKAEVVAEIPDDSLGRRTPRGAVSGFIQAVADQNTMRASRYLNLRASQRKTRTRERIVTSFQQLLVKGGNILP